MRWSRHVVRVEAIRNTYKTFSRKTWKA